MTTHSLTHTEARRSPIHPVRRNGLVHLGLFHFWLLAGVLGGMLALVGLVFFIRYVSL